MNRSQEISANGRVLNEEESRVQRECDAARRMLVMKARIPEGDGWRFVVAKSRHHAAKQLGVPVSMTKAASKEDLLIIAVRALGVEA